MAARIAAEQSVVPSPFAPSAVMFTSRAGNTGSLMRRRMSPAVLQRSSSRACSATAIIAALVVVRNSRLVHMNVMISCPATIMLNDTLYRVRRIEGLQQLQKRGERGAREISSLRLRLAPGATHKYHLAGEETILVL